MKTTTTLLSVAAVLVASLVALPASAEKPQLRPYAAGSPSGGIPLWNPGEKWVAIAGGACSGSKEAGQRRKPPYVPAAGNAPKVRVAC